ncbi:MAG: hypothetical protein LBE13_21255 [Bacteroidales bacterium]|jgi:hypothetical protein|nr:hypothetical protein [Bacteroidales bacterium]
MSYWQNIIFPVIQNAAVSVQNQQNSFEAALSEIESIENLEQKTNQAVYVLGNMAVYPPNGYFYSKILEKVFLEYSKSFDLENYAVPFLKNSFLHVVTRIYETDGHARVIEQWLDITRNKYLNHIVVLGQDNDFPDAFKQKAGQSLIRLDYSEADIKEKALSLRKLALQYEYIVIHTFPNDPTATIAFGTEKFPRPVIFFNNSAHLFWLGKSISDIVVECDISDKTRSKVKRNIDSFILGIPPGISPPTTAKISARKNLGIPLDKKIILTSGSFYKYPDLCGQGFDIYTLIKKIKDSVPDVFWYALVGLANKDISSVPFFSKGFDSSWIFPAAEVNHNTAYFDYVNAADLIIDTFPMPGQSALADAVACGRPVLSLAYVQSSYIMSSSAYCTSASDLIEKAVLVLTDESCARRIQEETCSLYKKEHSPEQWLQKLEQCLALLPAKHQVKDISYEVEPKEIDAFVTMLNLIYTFCRDFYDR